MNRKSRLLLLASITVAVVAWLVLRPTLTPRVAPASEKTDHAAASPSPALAALGSVAAVEPAKETPKARLIRGGEAVATGPAQPGVDGKSRTARIVRVKDFKYPLLRIEETKDAPALVMVADHCIVKKPATQSDPEFRAAVARRGFNIRKKMLAPDTYLIAFTTAVEAELLPRFPEALRELSTLGRAEPDYIVEAFGTPNDAYQHLLWGMHNVTAHIAVTGSTNVYTEGGKMSYAGEIPAGGITAALIDCTRGKVGEFPPEVSGQIALIERGDITFSNKAVNAKNAGAVAVLIYNNAPGGFAGTLNAFGDWLPVVPLAQSAGQSLLASLPATVTLSGMPNGKDISAREAWDTQTGSTNVLVGIIDTGIDYNHPDLAANIWTNPGETGLDANRHDKATNGIDDDGNGFVDDVHGWDFCNDDNNPMDDNNHGTHCAGTIGGTGNNALGVVGVNWRVKMAAIKFLDSSGSGYDSDGVDCVYYGTRIGVRLTSNSWGGGAPSETMREAIEDANTNGILFVAAAGNSATSAPMYPAGYDNDNIISVAATDSADQLASFSNYGLPHVDLAAPGVGILSTVPLFNNPPYAFFNGTSMACPHVAGAAALLKAQVPSLPHLELKARLLATADPIPALTGKCVTGGRLNVAAALAGLSETPAFTLTATAVADTAPGGNGDGVINPGETISLVFTVSNAGYQAATNVTATFRTTDAYSAVTDSNCTFGTIARRSAATAADPVTLTIAAGTPVPHTVAATLTLRDAAARTWVLPVTLLVSTTHHLSGTVTLDGAPLAGATVTYTGPMSGTATTAGGGGFDLAVPTGEFGLRASYNGTELSKTPVLTFTTPGDQTGITFALTNATISGTVVDHASGSPVGNATVTFVGPVVETVTTDGAGAFGFTRIYGRAVEWQAVASQRPPYEYSSAAQTITVPPSATGRVFRLGQPAITFNAEGQDGWLITLAPSNTTTRTLVLTNSGVANLRWQFAGIVNGGGTRGAVLASNNPPAAITTPPDGSAHDGQYLYWLKSGTLYKQDPATFSVVSTEYLPETIVGCESSWRLALFDGRYFWFEAQVPDPNNSGHRFLNLHAVDLAAHLIVETVEVDRQLYVSTDSNEGYTWGNARCGALAEGVFWFYWSRTSFDDGLRYHDMARIDRMTGQLLSHYLLPAQVNHPYSNYNFTDFTYMNGALWMIHSTNGNIICRNVYKLDPLTGTILATITPPDGKHLEIVADPTGALWLWNDKPTPKILRRIDSGERLWLTSAPGIGEIPEGAATNLTLTFDSSIVATGVYHGAIRISSNDRLRPNVYVPVVLNVTAGTPGNNPPVITTASPASPVTLNENTSQAFTIAASDPNGDTINKQWAVDGLVVGGNTLSYTYNANYFSQGTHAIAVRAHDGKGGVAMRAWQIYANNVNRVPVASNATYTVANTDSLTFSLAASDPDNEPLTWHILSQPSSGTLSGNAPNLTYTPTAGVIGPVSFTFKVNDGEADSIEATVNINVGYRDVEADVTPLVVTTVLGRKPTRTLRIRNTGTTPLRWSAPMTSSRAPVDAGASVLITNTLPIPTGYNFLWKSFGLAYDGTNLLIAPLELTQSGAYYRSHLVRINPATGALVGPTMPMPMTSAYTQHWFTTLAWTGSGVWGLKDDWVSDIGGRMIEVAVSDTALTLLHSIWQVPEDFGAFNCGIAYGHDSVWVSTAKTTGSDVSYPGGIFRIKPGTKQVLDRFDLPDPTGDSGPIAYWNGALWVADWLGGPISKINPFNGEKLGTVQPRTVIPAQDMAEDRAGKFFIRAESDPTTLKTPLYRVHSGDYLLMNPDCGTLAGNEETTITVTFDSVLAGAGTHNATIYLLSDDPDEPKIPVPVTFTVLAQETFTAWAARYSAGAATANPDGDAYVNLLEFIFGLNPLVPDRPALYAGGMENGQYVFRAELSTTATGVTTEWQTSLDLQTWSPAAPATTEVLDLGDRERFTFRFNLTPGQNRLFLRMKVTQ